MTRNKISTSFSGQHLLHNQRVIHEIVAQAIDSAILTITRRVTPFVPLIAYSTFWALARHMLKNPQQPLDFALWGVFTPPQLKHLRKQLAIKHDVPVAELSERQWGIIFNTMSRYVPKCRWPQRK